MRVLLFGASGMVGAGVLIECLADDRVEAVLAVGRTSCGVVHPKLSEHLRRDFLDFGDARAVLAGYDACCFCLGVSSAGMAAEDYHRITYDVTIAAAETLAELNPGMTFSYVSGEGTDSTERGRVRWARVKGKTENHLLRLPLEAYMFRPGFIQPLKGVRSKTRLYQAFYTLTTPLYPVFRRLLATHITTTENVGRAMIEVAAHGYERRLLENADINALAGRSRDGAAGDA